ncbi:unnamed protein product [Blepharisma stoltei]|uniref:Uncharacterized protein n=1 Tax=Blepharisma stoltei TaxID=1481888 RepID=A0AAU9JBY2_9CILI|nr:unnamed protein product [Blepharisma stoltei]
MNLLDELLQENSIRKYLRDFPKTDWPEVIKKTLLYGIHSLTALQSVGLTSPRMGNLTGLKIQLGNISSSNHCESTTHTSNSNQNRSNSQPSTKKFSNLKLDHSPEDLGPRDHHHRCRKSSRHKPKSQKPAEKSTTKERKELIQPPFKLTGRDKTETKRTIPKHLQNVDSKIKDDIQKYKQVAKYTERYLVEEPDLKENSNKYKCWSYLKDLEKQTENIERRHAEKPSTDRSFIKDEEDYEKNRHKRENERGKELLIKTHEIENDFEKVIPHTVKNRKLSDDKLQWEDWGSQYQTADFSRDIGTYGTSNEVQNPAPLKPEVQPKSPASSTSSFSTYQAPEEIKQFYQKEFKNLMPEEVPKRLKPVELPLKQDVFRISSYSVQPIYCSSEDDDKSIR